MAQFPNVTYSNVKHKVHNGYNNGEILYRDEDITILFNNSNVNMTYKASYNAPYNQVSGQFTSDISIARFEIRVTPVEDADYGPGIGSLVFFTNNVLLNTSRNFSFDITPETFYGSQSDTYRICLLTQSELDYSWDFTQLYMVLNNSGTTYVGYTTTDTTAPEGYEVHGMAQLLPNDYQQLEFIQSTGTQWIDTEINMKASLRFDLTLLPTRQGTDERFLGAYDNGIYIGQLSSKWRYGPSCSYNDVAINYTTPTRITAAGVNWTFGDTAKSVSALGSNNFKIVLFGAIYKTNPNTPYGYGSCKLYSCKIWDGDTPLRHFIPARRKSDNVLGLYDLISGKFFTNAGSGSFLAGSITPLPYEYQQVEYIEGIGTQYMAPFYLDNTKALTGNLTVGYKFTVNEHTDAMYFSTITSTDLTQGQAYSLGYTAASSVLYIRWQQAANASTKVDYIIPEVCEVSRTNAISNVRLNQVSLFCHSTNYKPWKGKIYSYWLKIDDQYLFNFIPCYRRYDGAIGFFELVSGTFHTNVGSGNFTKGNSV